MVVKKKVSASGNSVVLELARKHGLSVEVVQDIVSSASSASK